MHRSLSVSDRKPVLLVILIETDSLRWYAGAIASAQQSFSLLRSEPGDLGGYASLPHDAQVSFLRHRLAGVMQRGGDRLYLRQMKTSRFLLIADGPFEHSASGATEHLAEHFVQWLMNPPATYLQVPKDFALDSDTDLKIVAGELPDDVREALRAQLPELIKARRCDDRWESVVRAAPSDSH